MQNVSATLKVEQELMIKLKTLRETYGTTHRWSVAGLLKTMGSCACERQIKYLLENGDLSSEFQRFDPYYREKSEFATIKILESIKRNLLKNGLEDAIILTEKRTEIGRFDIVILRRTPIETHGNGMGTVRIEVKASLGLDLEQIERYLWHPSTLIIVRVMTEQVTKIEPLRFASYVLFSLKELSAKIDRVLSGQAYTIPGTSCFECFDGNCPHNARRNRKLKALITMSNGEFAEDLETFFCHLSYVSERTASMVVEELRNRPNQTEDKRHACSLQNP